jgi:glycosyltransferase involved in cell wall biosynthesis
MRLLHLVDSLEFGGLERVVTDLAVEQVRQGHQVGVFSLQSTEGFAAELARAGVEVTIGHKQGSLDLHMLRRLRGVIKDRRIELVHAHNFVPNYHAAAATLWLRHKPVIVGTCHDMGTRLANRRLRAYYRWSLPYTAGLAMVGKQVHDRFVDEGFVPADKAVTVLNGIPVDRFAWTPAQRAAARGTLGVADGDLLVGAVGRLVGLKNHRLLIEQMPALVARFPSLKLAIIGGGPLQEELTALAAQHGLAGRVMLLGQRADVSALTPAFDVFAMTSLTEGLSIALLEACATRLAIVATAVGGNPEIVHDGDTGLLVPPADGPALQAALARLLGDAALRERLAEQARRWVTAHASVQTLARAYEGFYRRFLPA